MRYTDTQIQEIARGFWDQAGEFLKTRDIFMAAKLVLPVKFVLIPDLSLLKVKEWLAASSLYNLIGDRELHDRVMHGLILPLRGTGLIFINTTDSETEKRFTASHEVSHFLLDHELPRQQTIMQLGSRIRVVLDGDVDPELLDEVTAAIRGIELRQHINQIEKDGDGSFRSWSTFNAENNADRLACELLAPCTEVIRETLAGKKNISYLSFVQKCHELLEQQYLLPPTAAYQYAVKLAYSVTKGPSIMDKLEL